MKSDSDLARKYMIPFVFAIGVITIFTLLLRGLVGESTLPVKQGIALGILSVLAGTLLGAWGFWIVAKGHADEN